MGPMSQDEAKRLLTRLFLGLPGDVIQDLRENPSALRAVAWCKAVEAARGRIIRARQDPYCIAAIEASPDTLREAFVAATPRS